MDLPAPGYFVGKQEDVPSPPPASHHNGNHNGVGGSGHDALHHPGQHHPQENRYSDINMLLDQVSLNFY